jgi:Nuclease-related domain
VSIVPKQSKPCYIKLVSIEFYCGDADYLHTHENEFRDDLIAQFGVSSAKDGTDGFVVFNFSCGGADIDAAFFGSECAAIIEVKDCREPISAHENGVWRTVSGAAIKGGKHGNPFQQVKAYRHHMLRFLEPRLPEFLSKQKASPVDRGLLGRFVVGLVCVYPILHPDSDCSVDASVNRWFRLVGFSELKRTLAQFRTEALEIRSDEWRRFITKVLSVSAVNTCPTTRWLVTQTSPSPAPSHRTRTAPSAACGSWCTSDRSLSARPRTASASF